MGVALARGAIVVLLDPGDAGDPGLIAAPGVVAEVGLTLVGVTTSGPRSTGLLPDVHPARAKAVHADKMMLAAAIGVVVMALNQPSADGRRAAVR